MRDKESVTPAISLSFPDARSLYQNACAAQANPSGAVNAVHTYGFDLTTKINDIFFKKKKTLSPGITSMRVKPSNKLSPILSNLVYSVSVVAECFFLE